LPELTNRFSKTPKTPRIKFVMEKSLKLNINMVFNWGFDLSPSLS
jgi:hypothetical protein